MPSDRSPSLFKRAATSGASWFGFGRDMHIIVLSAFAANVVGFANFQYLPLYVRQLGGTIEDLGFFFSVQTAILVLLVLVGGWLVDRYDRRLLFSLAAFSGGVAHLIMAVAPSWQWLVPGLAIDLFGGAIGAPIFFSLTSDIAPRGRRATYFGYQALAFSVCGIVGPLLGGLAFQYWSYRLFLLVGTVLSFAATYLRSLLRDPRREPGYVGEGDEVLAPGGAAAGGAATRRSADGASRGGLLRGFLGDMRAFLEWARRAPGVAAFLVLVSIPAFAGKLYETYGSVYLNEVAFLAPAAVGLIAAIASSSSIPANLFGGRLADRMGRRRTVCAAFIASGLWITTYSLVSGLAAFAALAVFDGLIHGGLYPSIDAWAADLCPSRLRGTFTGVRRLLEVLIAVPAPLAGAWLWSSAGPWWTIRAAAAVVILTAVLLFRFGPAAPAAGPSSEPGAPVPV